MLAAGDPTHDGLLLAFDGPGPGKYRPGDYWTFSVRAGEIPNEQTLIDQSPPHGPEYHRVALAEINWTAQQNTALAGWIVGVLTAWIMIGFVVLLAVTVWGIYRVVKGWLALNDAKPLGTGFI